MKEIKRRLLLVFTKGRILLLIGLLIEVSIHSSLPFRLFRTEDAGVSTIGFFGVELRDEFGKNNNGNQNITTFTLTYCLKDRIEPEIDFTF